MCSVSPFMVEVLQRRTEIAEVFAAPATGNIEISGFSWFGGFEIRGKFCSVV